jgi:hypothetical protein
MTEYLSFDLNSAYNEIKERGEMQAITSKEEWDALVEDYVNEKLDVGELDPDEDTESIESQLKDMWLEYEKNLNIR